MSDANDFFSTSEVSARLDLVRHLIENSELVPLVRGPSGIGKTLLATRLQQLAPNNWSVCHFDADPTMQPERLLATIARCSGLPDIAGELLQRLVDRFGILRKRGRIPVLLVDDAHMLPPTSLITLLRLFERQLDGVRLVSIVLFADEQIDLLLSTPQLQVMSPQAIQVIDLPVMTRQEAAAYMQFLLKNEGLSENLALDDVKLNRIYRETRGNPGLLASAILNAVGENGNDEREGSFLSGYKKQLLIGGLPLLIVVLLFIWLISSLIEPESEAPPARQVENRIEPLPAPAALPQSQIQMPEVTQTEAAPAPVVESAAAQNLDAKSQAPEKTIESIDESVTTAKLDVVTDSVVENSASPSAVPVLEESTASENRDEFAAVQGIKETPAEIEVESEQLAKSDQPIVADMVETSDMQQQPETPGRQPVAEINSQPVAEGRITDNGVESKTSAETPIAAVEEMVEPSGSAEEAGGDTAAIWVMSRSPDNYTLQLIAVENLASLQRYIDSNSLTGKTHTLQMTRNGKPLYALLWGEFPDRVSAQKAVSALPSRVQKTGVWARSFASLKQSMAR
ncbi:MAG: AAA family ATPase [Candidatus Thiodiazotropha endolucinida]|nr:AAA family ATPase [Candidatus Thiodiazotropha taylori]MCG8118673.1 AAA family ATPase [Candidatus Thiodiazotropha taylori]MCW4289029.1 AAA family ATPase [Candidatus Thiodiazotropha endolucinida]MCW4294357.1 AAA family ATPase [Candidatus Thiodiazotropha endolucinida]